MRFKTADYLLTNKPWDFFMMVEMGPDRLNHGIWSFIDPNHPRYEPDNPYKESLREYYRYLDGKIGELLDKYADDDTTVLVVSDHGAKAMVGGRLLQRVAAATRATSRSTEEMPDRGHSDQQDGRSTGPRPRRGATAATTVVCS